jgi:hypothetical protein
MCDPHCNDKPEKFIQNIVQMAYDSKQSYTTEQQTWLSASYNLLHLLSGSVSSSSSITENQSHSDICHAVHSKWPGYHNAQK